MRLSKQLLFLLLCTALQGQIIPTGSLDRGSGVTLSLPNATINPVLSSLSAVAVGDVNFTDVAELTVVLRPDQTATEYVDVTAAKPVPSGVSFYLDLVRDSDKAPCRGVVAPLTLSTALEENIPKRIPIEITGCPGYQSTGKLVILGSTGRARERMIRIRRSTPVWLSRSLVATLGASFLIVIICTAIVVYHGHKVSDPIGTASWDFGSSWASNVTAFSAALSFLIQFTIFPDKPVFGSRLEYALLTGFSVALITLAPAVNRALSSVTADASGTTMHSLVGGFLVACLLTVWGALLQVADQLLILSDLGLTATVSWRLVGVVVASIVIGCFGLIYYSWSTILWTVGLNAARSGTKLGKLKTFSLEPRTWSAAAGGSISVL